MSTPRIAILLSAVAACVVPDKHEAEPDAPPAGGAYPETYIDLAPGAFAPTPTVELRFSSDHVAATFVCGIDGAVPEACESPYQAVLVDGPHLFTVAAVVDGRRDQTAATASWVTDTVRPHARFLDAPDGVVAGPLARFEFTAGEIVTFTCRLDGGTPVPCESGHEVTVGEGMHALAVIATDRAGHIDDAPPTWSWIADFDAIAVDITSGPLGWVSSTRADFEFISNAAPGSGHECQLDQNGFQPCSSPHTLLGLPDGQHQVDIRVQGATALATRIWMVDTTPPVVTIGGPQGPTASTDASFQLLSEPTAVMSCRLDGGMPWHCPTAFQLTGLAQGPHSLVVTAVDAADNASQSPVVRTWIVDTVPPQTFLSQPTMTAPLTYAFTVSSNESGGTYLCQLDGGDYLPCPAQLSFTVKSGWHTLAAIAVDAAGNQALDAAMVSWEVL